MQIKNSLKRIRKHLTILLLILLIWTEHSISQSLSWLGTLGGATSVATDVSADGKVVVGTAAVTGSYSHAFRWTDSTGMQDLDPASFNNSAAFGVTEDGSVVVGEALFNVNTQGFRWTEPTGLVSIGTYGGGFYSQARDVSSDALNITGWAQPLVGFKEAIRWQSPSLISGLGTLGGNISVGYAISADGSVIVGSAQNSNGYDRAFRTENPDLMDLGTLGGNTGTATNVSSDGTLIVGYSALPGGQIHACLWIDDGSIIDLGTLGGNWSQAYDIAVAEVEADTVTIIVGNGPDSSGQIKAFRWIDGVMQNLNEAFGGLLVSGSYFARANAISTDGRYIVGSGFNSTTGRTEAFLLDTFISTSIEDELSENVLKEFTLMQNYPNPFNPSTTIKFSLSENSLVILKVYNIVGEEVATLVNEEKNIGLHSVNFDASHLSSGIYFYKIQAEDFIETRKMILIR